MQDALENETRPAMTNQPREVTNAELLSLERGIFRRDEKRAARLRLMKLIREEMGKVGDTGHGRAQRAFGAKLLHRLSKEILIEASRQCD